MDDDWGYPYFKKAPDENLGMLQWIYLIDTWWLMVFLTKKHSSTCFLLGMITIHFNTGDSSYSKQCHDVVTWRVLQSHFLLPAGRRLPARELYLRTLGISRRGWWIIFLTCFRQKVFLDSPITRLDWGQLFHAFNQCSWIFGCIGWHFDQ